MHAAPLYDRSQPGTLVLFALGGGAAVCGVVLAAVLAEEESPGAPLAVLAGVFALLGACAFLFRRLRVVVTDLEVVASFGSGWPRRAIPLSEVRGARAVRNRWWYGWGVRLVPRGWMFNVSGLDAVELELSGGRVFRIGTDDPEGLAAAIERVRGGARVSGLTSAA